MLVCSSALIITNEYLFLSMLTIDHGSNETGDFLQSKEEDTLQSGKVSVKVEEEFSKSSLKVSQLMPEESMDQSSDSHTTVRQVLEKQSSDNDSDHEISSLHERPRSVESETSESEVHVGPMKRSGTDSSDYELHSSVVLEKIEDADDMTQSIIVEAPKNFEALLENEEDSETVEHKEIPLEKQHQQIKSGDLLQRQIKDDMYEQVLSQEDDSVMSESTIESNIFKLEEKTVDSAISLGLTPSSNDALEGDSLADFEHVPEVKQAQEMELTDPDWEMLNQEDVEDIEKESGSLSKRSMTPEQALEVASEIVTNVKSEALKKYEEMVKTNQLPKPSADSKFTQETKEKVEDYIKELKDDDAVEMIQKVVSKKEEQLRAEAKFSVDISDDDFKSESMLNEMRNELRRRSISVTDEDLTTDMTHELLQEQNIDDIKRHLEDTKDKFDEEEEEEESDFKFKTSFRTHFVKEKDSSDSDAELKQIEDKDTEDIWAEDSKVILRKDYQSFIDKRSDNESVSQSSGSRQNLKVSDRKSDYEGYSSAGETSYFSAQELGAGSGQSRPTSSDVDAMLSAVSERSDTSNTEFITAQDISSTSDTTSHYLTAPSTLSSASVKSSESSGHLGSVEVSEASETLVESSLEYEHRLDDGSDTPAGFKQFDDLSCDEFDPVIMKKSPVELATGRRATHMRNPSTSFDPSVFDPHSPQEMQCLPEDDVDGCCLSTDKDADEEKESLIVKDNKFPIPDVLASKFSESRETLSSSVMTLSENTIVDKAEKELRTSTATLNQLEDVFQSSTDVLVSSVTMSSSSHSSWSTHVNMSPPKTSQEQQDDEDEDDQVFPLARARDSSEGAQSVHQQQSLPQEISVDFGSDYDSRPNSELKDVESRPLSTDRMSPCDVLQLPSSASKRSYSIDDTVSDNLRVIEPFARPKSPMPQPSVESKASIDSDEQKIKITAPESSPAARECLRSTDTYETELAFSQHFTQVYDETDFEVIKPSLTDLTPDSQLNSESMEISQSEDLSHGEAGKTVVSRALDDDLLVGSPPMVSRPLGVKYWPPIDNLDQEYDAVSPLDKRDITRSESDDNSDCKFELVDNEMIEKDVEEQKKWLESQFDGNQNVDDYAQYGYGQPLDQILEEEEDDRYSHSSEDIKELQKFKESISSTPDFEQIMGKRHHVGKSGDQDDLSMGSLTEFERLEREVALGSGSASGSRGSLGSNDSLETGNNNAEKPKNNLVTKVINSKSGTGDDVSVNSYSSLKSFEMMEQACKEAEINEKKAKHQEEVLSEIEEGHESQTDSESAETISEFGEDERSEKDYEDRLFEIDTIIKQAQANVEKFDQDKKPTDEISLKDILGRPESRTESVASSDSLEDPKIPDLPRETSETFQPIIRQSSLPTRIQSATASRTTSVTSLRSAASTVTNYDPDSALDRDLDIEDDLMQASVDSLDNIKVTSTMITSTDSLENSSKRTQDTMITSTDSLEGTPRKKQSLMTISTDSIETTLKKDPMTTSIDSLEGDSTSKDTGAEKKVKLSEHELMGASAVFMTSTDSIESTSTNTRATASMLSSVTSQGSETLVADDELEHDVVSEESRLARRYLLDQGNIHIDDSDDSATFSNSSPQVAHKVYKKETVEQQEMIDSIEEVLETEEIDEKGNIIVKKVIQRRTVPRAMTKSSEKRDDSCEETIEDVDESGNVKHFIIKRTLEQSETLDVIQERRHQRGLSPAGEIFKTMTDVQSPQSVKKGLTHTEKMTKVFDAPTPSPPASPPKTSFRSNIPIRKQ